MTFSPGIMKAIRDYTLQNALRFEGKAQAGNVISKIIGLFPDQKSNAKQLMAEIQKTVADVNALPLERQKEELLSSAPDMLERKQEERSLFGFLEIKEGDRVCTAFPPEPSKYPHIGHAKAAFMNYLLAKEYNGTFFLRFEDTNPELAKPEFYDIIINNMTWLGIRPDAIQYASDFMVRFYEYAKRLISQGDAYVCTCSSDEMKKNREHGVGCSCRDRPIAEVTAAWDAMHSAEEGHSLLRMKIDMAHMNTTMRDPALFRIINASHPRMGNQFRVWPTYDFENPAMDGITRITHRLRSKEFELRNELHRYIQRRLGFVETTIYEFARFNMTGVESSGRIIRDRIAKHEFVGWDDPRLTTIVALRRRGFAPKAIEQFVVNTGITKNEATLTWDDLIVQNRRIIESPAKRYFFIRDPVEITIKGTPHFEVTLHLHPSEKNGGRPFAIHGSFLVAHEDAKDIKDGETIRLMDCLNFRKHGKEYVFVSREHADFKGKGTKLIHWLPADATYIPVEIMMNDLSVVKGTGENHLEDMDEGEIMQFERFGFCRLDKKSDELYKFWFTHK